MYKIKFPHGIMFHHFHDNINHFKGQGSISAHQFEKLIKFIGVNNIVHPLSFLDVLKNKSKKVCFTFDDSLRCQHDIALPILNKYNIKAFFFLYTSIFGKNYEHMEIYRFFRDNYFDDIDKFYKIFFQLYEEKKKKSLKEIFKNKENQFKKTKKFAPFYSLNDIKYRYLRDRTLNKKDLHSIMLKIFRYKNVKLNQIKKKVFMSKKNIKLLTKHGHEIGLHSHTHPYILSKLNFKQQFREYKNNNSSIKKIINKNIFSMSHPCGSYNSKTLKILKKMKISLGFKSSLISDQKQNKINSTNLEIAREDHSNIINKIK